jgi:hypothetical protein
MKVQRDKYGSNTPKLTPDNLEGEAAVLTVAGFDEQTFDGEDGKRVTPFLWFKETGDLVLYINATQIDYLVERLGDESDNWIGKQVPVEKHSSTYKGQRFEKVWVQPPERWDDAISEANPRRRAEARKRLGSVKRKK